MRRQCKGQFVAQIPEAMRDFGAVFRALLGLYGLEQQEVAILGGWSEASPHRWATGKTAPNPPKRRVIEEGLGLPALSLDSPTVLLKRLKTAAFVRSGSWSKSDPRLVKWRQEAATTKKPPRRSRGALAAIRDVEKGTRGAQGKRRRKG